MQIRNYKQNNEDNDELFPYNKVKGKVVSVLN
jgi:hypothetical protein